MKIIQQAKDTHLPRKTVKFKKKKHKKSKWMTYGILTHESPSIEILHTKIIFHEIPSILGIDMLS